MKKIVLLLSAALLASCGSLNNSSNSEKTSQIPSGSSQIEESSSIISSKEEDTGESKSQSSSEENLTSNVEESSDEVSSAREESSEDESSSDTIESSIESTLEETSQTSIEEVGSWTIDSNSIEATEQNKYLYNYTFSVNSSLDKELSFYGDMIQRGTGQWAGHVQMKKYDDGESGIIESRFAMSGTLTLSVLMRTQYYNEQDHDFTGVPEVKTGEENNLSVVEASSLKEEDGYRIFTYEIDGYFSLAPSTGYAIYFSSLSFE